MPLGRLLPRFAKTKGQGRGGCEKVPNWPDACDRRWSQRRDDDPGTFVVEDYPIKHLFLPMYIYF